MFDTIVAYTFRAELVCPSCMDKIVRVGYGAGSTCRNADVEDLLNIIAHFNAIDRCDEYSFDSDNFPKVVFAYEINDNTCDHCDSNL